MKVKNIVFSGFAAAILMGTVNAHAAFEIASKAYVDGKVSANTQAVTAIQNALGDGIGTGDGETTVANALDGKVDKTAVSTSIPAADNASNDKWASEKAVADAIATVSGSVDNVQQQIEDALGGEYGGENPTVKDVLDTKADASTIAGENETLANGIDATTVVGAINELNTEKQNEADSNVQTAGTYIQTGHNVAANLTALDTATKAAKDVADAAVPRNMDGTNGKALIFNETDGGGAKFEHRDGTWSFTGVNDGGANGIAAQIYTVDSASKTGSRIDITKQGMYYTVGNQSAAQRMVEANEIATKGDIAAVGGNVGDMDNLNDGANTNFGADTDTVVEALNDLDNAVNTKADADSVYTKNQMDTLLGAKLDKPVPNTCTADSEHCVLHMDKDGNLSWVSITVPYIEETQTEPGE